MQAAALDGQGRLWTVEHGPKGGDELNRPEAGKNYGWPEVTYGIDYSGDPIGEGITANTETQQPVYYWDPVIAPSGMAYYNGDAIPEWKGAFLVGGLVAQAVVVCIWITTASSPRNAYRSAHGSATSRWPLTAASTW